MDNEFDHHTEVGYVCEDGITPVFFVSYTGSDNALLTFSMVNGADNGDQASRYPYSKRRAALLQSGSGGGAGKMGVDGHGFHLSELHGGKEVGDLTLLDLKDLPGRL